MKKGIMGDAKIDIAITFLIFLANETFAKMNQIQS